MKAWIKQLTAVALSISALCALPAARASAIGEIEMRPSSKATYVCSSPKFSTIASATDMWQIFGSGSKTVKILRITLNYVATMGSATINDFYLIKRSTANSGGTATTPTPCALDSNNSAASAVVKYYASGSNPTTGSTVAGVGMWSLSPIYTNALGSPPQQHVLFDHLLAGQALTLRGTGEGVVLNNNGQSLGGTSPTIAVNVIWTEE